MEVFLVGIQKYKSYVIHLHNFFGFFFALNFSLMKYNSKKGNVT